MGAGYLIDTNAIIDYLENKLPEKASSAIDSSIVNMSVITRIELLAWPKATEQQQKLLTRFIESSRVFTLSEDVIVKTIEIRKSSRLKLPDAIIAATAIVNDLSLLTRNVKDFENVDGLISLNPYSF